MSQKGAAHRHAPCRPRIGVMTVLRGSCGRVGKSMLIRVVMATANRLIPARKCLKVVVAIQSLCSAPTGGTLMNQPNIPRAVQASIARTLIVTWTSGVEHTINLRETINPFVAFELGEASGLPVTRSKRTPGCDRHMTRSTYALSQLDALTVCSHKPSPSKGRSSKAIALYLIPADVFMQTGTNVRGLCLV